MTEQRSLRLLPYQQECLDMIEKTFQSHNRQLFQLPTGAGKTAIFVNYIKRNSKRALIVVPTIEIKHQVHETCLNWGVDSIALKGKYKFSIGNHTIITSQSLNYQGTKKYLYDQKFDTIIIDEAHKAQCNTFKQFLDKIDPSIKVLGCTATPERYDQKPLLDIFINFSFSKSIIDLINLGYLCDIEAYKVKTGIKLTMRSFDFHTGQLKEVAKKELDSDSRNQLIINTYKNNLTNKKTLIFCLSVPHSQKIAHLLKKEGYKAKCIYGELNRTERAEVLEDFKSGKIQVLTNCQVLTEGFDEPSIEALLIARPTLSKSLYCQMIGRGLRKYPGKELCTIYELGDNNHKICDFNVLSGREPGFPYEYKSGMRINDLISEQNKISLDMVEVFEQKFSPLNTDSIENGRVSLLNSFYWKQKPNELQLNSLRKNEIFFFEDINFIEAAFLLWKHKLLLKYGFIKKGN